MAEHARLDRKASILHDAQKHIMDDDEHDDHHHWWVGSNAHNLEAIQEKLAVRRKNSIVVSDQQYVEKKRGSYSRVQENGSNSSMMAECIPDGGPQVIGNVVAGLVAGIKISIGMVVFANLMWTQSDALAQYLSIGVKMNYMTSVVLLGSYASFGTVPFGMVLCQGIPTLLVGKMGVEIAGMVEPANLLPTFTLLVMSQAVVLGAVFIICSALNYTAIADQVPHAVVGGFLSAGGASLWRASLAKLTNTPWAKNGFWPLDWNSVAEPANVALVGAGLLQCVLLLKGPSLIQAITKNRYINQVSGPLSLIVPIIVFYIALYASGHTVADGVEIQWLNPPGGANGGAFWMYWPEVCNFSGAKPAVILEMLPSMLACSFLSLLEAVMNVSGVDAVMDGKSVDMAKEVKAYGIANVISGLVGGNCGYIQSGMTINAKQLDKASHRICIVVAAVFTFSLFVTGAPVADYIPKFTSGGVFLFVGWLFIKKWMVDTLSYMPRSEYVVIWIIVIDSLVVSINHSMIVGMVLSSLIYINAAGAVNPVKALERGDRKHSPAKRSPDEELMLRKEGDRIVIISCTGFLFWASARVIVDTLVEVITKTKVDWLLVDLKDVPKIDVSAGKAFEKCVRVGLMHQIHIGFCGAEEYSKKLLEDLQLISTMQPDTALCMYFDTAEEGMEFCEDQLLDAAKRVTMGRANTISDEVRRPSNS